MKWLNNLPKEEQFNVLSHAIGIPMSILGAYCLFYSNQNHNFLSYFSIALYIFSLSAMFLCSTLYHAARTEKKKRKLRIVDHISIYFLIAGTYTPVTLITLIKGNGWYIFITVWIVALLGAILKLFFTGKYELVSLLLYLAMGWLIVLDIKNLLYHIFDYQKFMLILGGLFYTIGIFFYVKSCKSFYHFIWHLFVLGGALSHWFFIYSLIEQKGA